MRQQLSLNRLVARNRERKT